MDKIVNPTNRIRKEMEIFKSFCFVIIVFMLCFCHANFVYAEQYVLKFAHDQVIGSPHDNAAINLKKIVEEKTNGNVIVEVYPANQLGTSREQIELLQLGVLEGMTTSADTFSVYDMAFSIPGLPFLFSSKEKCHEILDGILGNKLLDILEQHKMIGSAYWESGFKCFTGNFPITHPDDFKGKKIRVAPSPMLVKQFESYGASAIPTDWGELYSSLQQGVVDGQENPLSSIYNMKFYEVQKYITISNHGFLGYIVAFSKDWIEKLPVEYQDIILNASREVAPTMRAEIAELEKEKYLPEIIAFGTEIIELSDHGREEFKNKADIVYEEFNKMLNENGKKLFKEILSEAK